MTRTHLLQYPLTLKYVNAEKPKWTDTITLQDIINAEMKVNTYFFDEMRIIHFHAIRDRVLFVEYQNEVDLTEDQYWMLKEAFYGDMMVARHSI